MPYNRKIDKKNPRCFSARIPIFHLHLELVRLRLQIVCHIGKAAARRCDLLHAGRLFLRRGGYVLRLTADALGGGVHLAHTVDNRAHILAQLEHTLADRQ